MSAMPPRLDDLRIERPSPPAHPSRAWIGWTISAARQPVAAALREL
jgi:hypothetical protein